MAFSGQEYVLGLPCPPPGDLPDPAIISPVPASHHPLLLLPSIFSSIMVFSTELALCLRWPKYWSFSFSISPSSEYSGLISFGIEWLDLLAVHGTLKSLLQHHSSKASILQSSALKEKREKGHFLHYWWECNLIQSLWRRVSRFLKKLGNKTTK